MRANGCVTVTHGEWVGVADHFFVEGTWNDDFPRGNFASTEGFFGSGAVIGNDSCTFVSSCSTTDVLFYVEERRFACSRSTGNEARQDLLENYCRESVL